MPYTAHPKDERDRGGKNLPRACWNERTGSWLVYRADGDTCGVITQRGEQFVGYSQGNLMVRAKTLRAAILPLLPLDERPTFEGKKK